MSDFEDKLNALLSNPDSMAQVMQLAQNLSRQEGGETPASPPVTPRAPAPAPPAGAGADGGGGLGDLLGGLDPQMLLRFAPVLREAQSGGNSDAAQLLLALRPYLKAEKQEKVARAIQIARLIRVGKKFFSSLEERDV